MCLLIVICYDDDNVYDDRCFQIDKSLTTTKKLTRGLMTLGGFIIIPIHGEYENARKGRQCSVWLTHFGLSADYSQNLGTRINDFDGIRVCKRRQNFDQIHTFFVNRSRRDFFVQELMELRRSSRNWNSRSSTKCSGQMFDVGGESKGVACLKRKFIGFDFAKCLMRIMCNANHFEKFTSTVLHRVKVREGRIGEITEILAWYQNHPHHHLI